MPNETVQTPQVPSANVAAAQATLSVPAATAQVSSAAHICFLVNFLYFIPSCSFRLACSFRLLMFCGFSASFIPLLFSTFYVSFYICLIHASSCLHVAVLYVICLNLLHVALAFWTLKIFFLGLTCLSLFCTLLLPSGLYGFLFCHMFKFILHAAL